MDVFITLLSLGVNGYKNLISQRKEMYKYLKEELGKVATKHGERLLDTKNNPISLGKLSLFVCVYSKYTISPELDCSWRNNTADLHIYL